MKRFVLQREHDATGVSGTGRVAEGLVFSDGTVVMRWCVEGRPRSTVTYDSIESLLNIHDHKDTKHAGGTSVVFLD